MTRVIELYGGPGTGKSTSAALLFAYLKLMGKNAELVREYVKEWAWEGKRVRELDQFYLFGKQLKRESMVYGKVDWVVTDSPICLGIAYAEQYAPPQIAETVKQTIEGFYTATREMGVQRLPVFLKRSKPYNPAGRYQTEEEARQLDEVSRLLISRMGWEAHVSGTEPADLLQLLGQLGIDSLSLGDLMLRFDSSM